MSMITNLVDRLKEYSRNSTKNNEYGYKLLEETIFTINELSAKIAEYNQARSSAFYDGKKSFYLKINNLPFHDLDKYTVVRHTGSELWYYGTYDNEDFAYHVADELENGFVVELI